MTRLSVVVVLWTLAVPSSPAAQSLAEIARQEEARRKAIKTASKLYTNADLTADAARDTPAGDQTTPPRAAAAAGTTPSDQVPSINIPGGSVADVDAAAADVEAEAEEKGEAYWRQRITSARAALERSRVLADALQSRLNALAADIVNRDDPAQRSQLELERQRALAELERTQTEIAAQTAAIGEIEEEARKAGVPAGWLR